MKDRLNELEKQFYSDGFKIGMKAGENKQCKKLISSVIEMYSAFDEFNDSFQQFSRAHNQSVDCKRGCSWCCYQPVFALNYEIEALNEFINQRFDAHTRSEIYKRAITKQNKLKDLSVERLLNSKSSCPLLKDGYCMVYEARPMGCRIYLSSNLKSCLKFFNEPDDKENYPALLQFPMRIGRLMNEGFKSGLKSHGIKVNEFRIEEGILKQPSTF